MPDNNNKNMQLINDHIKRGLNELTTSQQLPDQKTPDNYYSQFEIKTKKRKIKSALKSVAINDKYRKFTGSTTNKKKGAYGPAEANAMDSAPGTDTGDVGIGDGGAMGGGFGLDAFGITAFGESINNTKSEYIAFLNSLNEVDGNANSATLETVINGYKTLFDSMEQNSTVIMCGIQPSMAKFFGFSIQKLVNALNVFNGNIVSMHLGSSVGAESSDIIKQWYSDIGVHSNVIDEIIFIEKCNEIPEPSSLDYVITSGNTGLNSKDVIKEFCELTDSPILVGCTDVYFMAELIMMYGICNKHVDVDTNFAFNIPVNN